MDARNRRRASVNKEPGNLHDNFAVSVSVVKNDCTVGHIPRSLSKVTWFFLTRGGTVTCRITGSHKLDKTRNYACTCSSKAYVNTCSQRSTCPRQLLENQRLLLCKTCDLPVLKRDLAPIRDNTVRTFIVVGIQFTKMCSLGYESSTALYFVHVELALHY